MNKCLCSSCKQRFGCLTSKKVINREVALTIIDASIYDNNPHRYFEDALNCYLLDKKIPTPSKWSQSMRYIAFDNWLYGKMQEWGETND